MLYTMYEMTIPNCAKKFETGPEGCTQSRLIKEKRGVLKMSQQQL